MGEYQKARSYLHQWSEIASFYADWMRRHYLLATTYVAEGDLENSLKEMENRDVLFKQKSDTVGLAYNQFNICWILYESGKIKETEEKFAALIKLMESSDLSEETKNSIWRGCFWGSTLLAVKKVNIPDTYKPLNTKIPKILILAFF